MILLDDIKDIKLNSVYCGNSSDVLKKLPDNFIDLTVTSPPYDTLRNYKGYVFPFEDIANELYRVTKDGGVVVWVVGDETVKGSESGTSFRQALYFMSCGFLLHDTMIYEKNGPAFPAKASGNRYSQISEYMFVFSKGKPKTANLICDKRNRWEGWIGFGQPTQREKSGELVKNNRKPVSEFSPRFNTWRYYTGKNYTTKDDIAENHPAAFPELLAFDHIRTWSVPGDVVLDPCAGSGTTLKMASGLGRKYIGIDISEEYCKIAEIRSTIQYDCDEYSDRSMKENSSRYPEDRQVKKEYVPKKISSFEREKILEF